ncbi:hypothetical protein G7Y79_00025g058100 [Physcia stellaris]|nr:hypothetical protein G7Y79_00025g058100 [Physcia stellaris]
MRFLRATLLSLLPFFSLPSTSFALPASDLELHKPPQAPPLPIEVIYEFPPQTWVENLAVHILIHSFAGYNSLLGIAELHPNIFYLAAGNFSLTSGGVPGSWAIFELDLSKSATKPRVTKTADFPHASFLNGIAALHKAAGTLLVADSGAGVVYRLNVRSGKASTVIDDPTMKPLSPGIRLGVNGLKIRARNLYFTNSQQGLLARIPIQEDGVAAGPAVVLSRDVGGADDFVLDPRGDAFVAENVHNRLAFLRPEGGNATNLAGAPLQDRALLAGPSLGGSAGIGRGYPAHWLVFGLDWNFGTS